MNLFHLYCRLEFFLLSFFKIITFKKVGKNSIIKYGLFGGTNHIEIGNYVYIGENIHMWGEGGITIYDNTIIGPHVTIRSTNHDYKKHDFLPYGPGIEKKEVVIGKNCWIGESVLITPGSTIGEGSIIGMGTVVSGNIPPFSIIVGASNREINKRDISEYKRLEKEGAFYLQNKLKGKI